LKEFKTPVLPKNKINQENTASDRCKDIISGKSKLARWLAMTEASKRSNIAVK
jgi:hypothetical protein